MCRKTAAVQAGEHQQPARAGEVTSVALQGGRRGVVDDSDGWDEGKPIA